MFRCMQRHTRHNSCRGARSRDREQVAALTIAARNGARVAQRGARRLAFARRWPRCGAGTADAAAPQGRSIRSRPSGAETQGCQACHQEGGGFHRLPAAPVGTLVATPADAGPRCRCAAGSDAAAQRGSPSSAGRWLDCRDGRRGTTRAGPGAPRVSVSKEPLREGGRGGSSGRGGLTLRAYLLSSAFSTTLNTDAPTDMVVMPKMARGTAPTHSLRTGVLVRMERRRSRSPPGACMTVLQ